MPTSEEDLNAQAATVDALRQEVEEAEALRVQRENDTANDVTMAQLQAEEARLRARLAAAKAATTDEAVETGSNAPLEAAKNALRAAVAQQEAAEATPDESETGEQVQTSAATSPFSTGSSFVATPPSIPVGGSGDSTSTEGGSN